MLPTFTSNQRLLDAAVEDVLPLVAKIGEQLSSTRHMRDLDPRRVLAQAWVADMRRDVSSRAERDGLDPEELTTAAEERIRHDRRLGAAKRAGRRDNEWATFDAAIILLAMGAMLCGTAIFA